LKKITEAFGTQINPNIKEVVAWMNKNADKELLEKIGQTLKQVEGDVNIKDLNGFADAIKKSVGMMG
jgi:hypothetical protein